MARRKRKTRSENRLARAAWRAIETPKPQGPEPAVLWFDEVNPPTPQDWDLSAAGDATVYATFGARQQGKTAAIHEYLSSIDRALFAAFYVTDVLSPAHIKTAVRTTMATPDRGNLDPKPLETFWQEEPVVGWRAWKLNVDIKVNEYQRSVGLENVRLRSHAFSGVIWEPRVPHRAKCAALDPYHGRSTAPEPRHAAPLEWCSCGVHSFRSLSDLMPKLHYSGEGVAIGQVAHWGRTIQCRRGWRSEFAYPLNLSVLEIPNRVAWHPPVAQNHMDAREEIARHLQVAYGIPAQAQTFNQAKRQATLEQAAASLPVIPDPTDKPPFWWDRWIR